MLVAGPDHLTPSAAACCAACGDHAAAVAASGEYGALGCNVWVWCDPANPACGPSARQCWLKHLPAAGAVPPRRGPGVPFTSGVTVPRAHEGAIAAVGEERAFSYHTVITAAGPAVHWQSRVAFYWWSKVKQECVQKAAAAGGGGAPVPCHMGGFTRILHEGREDNLMAEIPTFVAQPLEGREGGGAGGASAGGGRVHGPPSSSSSSSSAAARPRGGDGGYVVLNRPWAVVQWMRAAPPAEPYVLMGEPDHLWLAPLPNPLAAASLLSLGKTGSKKGRGGSGARSHTPRLAAYPFFYIEPASAPHLPITARFFAPQTPGAPPFTPDLASAIPPIGNSPTLLSTPDLAALAPVWDATARAVFEYAPARDAWGWVLEMYAFAIAAVRVGLVSPATPAALFPSLMSQPPWEGVGAPFPPPGTYLLHYTYALDYDANGTATPGVRGDPATGGWRFDKRDFARGPPPRNLALPPPSFRDGAARAVVEMINAATAALPGWDAYAASGGESVEAWDGVSFLDGRET